MRWTTLLLLTCIAVGTVFLTGLGIWQMKRLAWKEALIERVEAGLKKPPVSVGQIESELAVGKDIEYRPATASGLFLHDHESHFFATHKGKPGYFVYTPLKLNDGRLLFVNRGFVPIERKSVSLREQGQITSDTLINGLARGAPAGKPNSFVPDNDLAKNVFYWKSIDQMTGRLPGDLQSNVLPFFLDADETPVPGGVITGGVTRITFPNSHLQYALTWFGLAGALLVVGASFAWSRRNSAVS